MGKFDEIFDDVVVNAKACASAVSRKRQQFMMFQSTRLLPLKSEAISTKSFVNSVLLHTNLRFTEQTIHSRLNIVSEISDLKDNLDVVNEHIAVAKDQRRCPGCNAVIPKNSVFCNICGIKIDDTDEDFEL